jgi:hypothetical protein
MDNEDLEMAIRGRVRSLKLGRNAPGLATSPAPRDSLIVGGWGLLLGHFHTTVPILCLGYAFTLIVHCT